MKNIKFYLSIFLIIFKSNIYCQENNFGLINDLKNELFTHDTSQILLFEFLSNNDPIHGLRCRNERVDSTLMIRKNQPGKIKVQSILKSIMMTKDSNLFGEVLKVYNLHMKNYKIEWENVEYYSSYPCETVTEQFDILKSFEVCLTSLHFVKSKFNSKQIFDFEYNKIKLDDNFNRDIIHRNEYYDKYLIFNEDYKRLLKKAWLRGTAGFSYLDPFVDDLAPYYLNAISKSKKTNDREDFVFIFLNNQRDILAKINTDKICEALCRINEHYFNLDKEYIIRIFLEKGPECKSLMKAFANNWIKKDYPKELQLIDNYVADLAIKNINYLPIITSSILDYASVNKGKKINYLKKFQDQNNLESYLRSLINEKSVSKGKKDMIKGYLKNTEKK